MDLPYDFARLPLAFDPERLRIHIPIQTHPDITFFSGDSSVHMAAGESWVFNTWNMHSVKNDTEHTRIHIVADTVGSAALWDLIEKGAKVPGERTRYPALSANAA